MTRSEDASTLEGDNIGELIPPLLALRSEMLAESLSSREHLQRLHPTFAASGRNLLHYLALRRHDLRSLQLRLAAVGLSSLGRAESHVLQTLDAVLRILHRAEGRSWPASASDHDGEIVKFAQGDELLTLHANELLGPSSAGRDSRIMVTMPSEAAHDYLLVHDLVREGMNCMRINCAHDNADAWLRMIAHLRRAEDALDVPCRVVMDLAGPKLRTTSVGATQATLHLRPRRDVLGRVVAPARVWLTRAEAPQAPPSAADAAIPVPASWLDRLTSASEVEFRDSRDAKRAFVIEGVGPTGCWGRLEKGAYIVAGTELRIVGAEKGDETAVAVVAAIPPSEGSILLREGDLLLVTRDPRPGRPAERDATGVLLTPAHIGCSIPSVFEDVKSGDSIWFDDGKIGGIVEGLDAHALMVRITHTQPAGDRLRADKGINLPDTALSLPALTASDIDALSFVARHADVVELSFANSVRDVEALQAHLARLGTGEPAIVLKIETRRGFENLPEMLLAAMRAPRCGVMIARGDLAVECGFERLAEVQEEILWICEAAHVPVIWATQVLETLAKSGMPSRAEISDAAMGHRAECVMLNKGPYVQQAMRTLDDILRRMQAHQAKKRSMLRELRLAHVSAEESAVPPEG